MEVTRKPVLVIGDVMHDIVVRLGGPFRPATDQNAEIIERPGGSAANMAMWMAHVGVPVAFVAAVGDDECAALSGQMQARGVEAKFHAVTGVETGRLVALVDADGERSFLTDRGANDYLPPEHITRLNPSDYAALLISGYAFIGDGSRAALRDLIVRSNAQQVRVVIDAASAGYIDDLGPEQFLELIAGASDLLANADEACVLSGVTEVDDQMNWLGARFDRVIVKQGASGVRFKSPDGVGALAAQPIDGIVDSTGAGDAFAAAYVAGLIEGATLRDAVLRGARYGALAVQQVGGQPFDI